MNNTNNSQPILFLLVGLPGSGKTLFAKKFAKEYNIPFINSSFFRYLLIDNPTHSKEEFSKLNKLNAELLIQFFKTKKSILLEGDFNKRIVRNTYSKMAKKHGYKTILIWVKNDEEESLYRATTKNRFNPKDFLITEEEYQRIASTFTDPNEREETIVISGKHAFKNQYKTILKNLAKPTKK